jgi:hypothetical protein
MAKEQGSISHTIIYISLLISGKDRAFFPRDRKEWERFIITYRAIDTAGKKLFCSIKDGSGLDKHDSLVAAPGKYYNCIENPIR